MPRYRIVISRRQWHSATLILDAADPAEAKAEAKRALEEDNEDPLDWECEEPCEDTLPLFAMWEHDARGLHKAIDDPDGEPAAQAAPAADPEEERRKLAEKVWSHMGFKPI